MKDLQMLYMGCLEKLAILNIEVGNIQHITINTRAKSRWGRCRKTENRFGISYTIDISSELLKDEVSDRAAEETMLHELIHTCKGCFNHGPEWKRLAEKVNRAYGYNVKRVTSAEEKGIEIKKPDIKKIAKYKFVCTGCGQEIYRQRESKFTRNPNRYICAKCGGSFKREY